MARPTSFIDDQEDQDYLDSGDFVDPNRYGATRPDQIAAPRRAQAISETDEEQATGPTSQRIESPDSQVFGQEVQKNVVGSPALVKTPAELARAHVAELAGQRPERPKPGFWRNLGSIAAGLGAGYANATGKGMPQVDVGQVMDNVKFGGYGRKVGDWASKVNDAATQAESLEKGEKEAKDNAVQASTANLQGAEARLADARKYALEHPADKGKRYITLPGGGGIYDTVSDTIIGGKQYFPVGANGVLDSSTGEVIGAPKKEPKPLTNSDYIEVEGPDGKTHKYLPDANDPGNKDKMHDMGIVTPKADPMALLTAREAAADGRQKRREDQQTANALTGISRQEANAYEQIDGKFSALKKALDTQYDGQIDPKTKHRRPTMADPTYAAAAQQLGDQWQKEKQTARNAAETGYAQHGQNVEHFQHPPQVNLTPKAPGLAAPPPVPGGQSPAPPAPNAPPQIAVDPRVKAYADKFFKGDVAAAKAAIAQQRAGK